MAIIGYTYAPANQPQQAQSAVQRPVSLTAAPNTANDCHHDDGFILKRFICYGHVGGKRINFVRFVFNVLMKI